MPREGSIKKAIRQIRYSIAILYFLFVCLMLRDTVISCNTEKIIDIKNRMEKLHDNYEKVIIRNLEFSGRIQSQAKQIKKNRNHVHERHQNDNVIIKRED